MAQITCSRCQFVVHYRADLVCDAISCPGCGEPLRKAPKRGSGHRVPLSVTLCVTLLVVGLNIYWLWAFAGPFRWFAELQILCFNEYSMPATALATVLASAGPMMVPTRILNRFGVFDRFATAADRSSAPRPWIDWCINHSGALMGLAIGVGFVFAGFYQYVQGRTAGHLIQVDAAQFEAGKSPPSRWIEIKGRFLPGQGIKEMSNGQERSHYHYYPLVSAAWKAGEPVGVIVKAPAYLLEKRFDAKKLQRDVSKWLDHVEAESRGFVPPGEPPSSPDEEARRDAELERLKKGMLARGRLPGIAVTGLERSGYRLASPYYVLDCMNSPASEMDIGKLLMALGIAIIAITGVGAAVCAWWQRRRVGGQSMLPPRDSSTDAYASADLAAPHVKLGADGKDGIMYL